MEASRKKEIMEGVNIGDWGNIGAMGAIIAIFIFLITKHIPASTAQFLAAIEAQRKEYIIASGAATSDFTKELRETRAEFIAQVNLQRVEYIGANERQRDASIAALNKQTTDFSKMLTEYSNMILIEMRAQIQEIIKGESLK